MNKFDRQNNVCLYYQLLRKKSSKYILLNKTNEKIEFLEANRVNPLFSSFLLIYSPSLSLSQQTSISIDTIFKKLYVFSLLSTRFTLTLDSFVYVFVFLSALKKILQYYDIFGNLAKERLNWH